MIKLVILGLGNDKSMKKILQYGSPLLEKVSAKVEDYRDPKVQNLINEMLKVLKQEEERSAGLSAPQIGEGLRIAICRRTDLEEDQKKEDKKKKKEEPIWEVMINPEIVKSSEKESIHWEGCLSVNYGDLFGKVSRPKEIEVAFTDLRGDKKTLPAAGFFSHVVQHEIDHLNGILFLKYVKDPADLYTGEELVE